MGNVNTISHSCLRCNHCRCCDGCFDCFFRSCRWTSQAGPSCKAFARTFSRANSASLTTVPVEDTRSALDAEMRNRGYTHLATRSNTQFTGVAKSLFPFAKKPAVTDVYAGQAHWLVIASANGMTTASDWQSAMVVKDSTGAYAVSREHADLHNEIRQAVSSSSQ